MTLAEWKAQLAGQGTPVAADEAPDQPVDPNSVMHGAPLRPRKEYNGSSLETDETDPEGRFLSFTDDPMRYLGHAAKGVARSPLDLVKGLLGLATTRPDKSLSAMAKPIANAIKHPLDTLGYANTHPDEVGSLVGQTVLGGALPDAANAVVEKGPGIAGRAMSATGRGVEAVGDFSAKTNKKGIVPLVTAATGHPWLTAAELAAPPVLRATGRGLQRGGAALEGLDLSLRDRTPVAPTVDPAQAMREKVASAREDVDAGFSRPVASKMNGLESTATDISHPTAEVAGAGELFPYQSDAIRGLQEAAANKKAAAPVQELANKFRDNAWANDKSAQPVAPSQSPIEQFYENDPQARIGGEGRKVSPTTSPLLDDIFGDHEDLNTIGANGSEPHMAPSALDELSQLSGRALSPADADALFKRFRNFKGV